MKKVYVLALLSFFISGIYAQVNVNAPWIWVNGDKHLPMRPTVGAKNVTLATNNPGGRKNAVSWSQSGVTWMFGGYGFGGNSQGFLNDLWKYDQTTKLWTWVSGDNTVNTFGVYGTLGVASNSNKPGSRRESSSWIGSDGNFYLFGGWGYSAADYGKMNDLWRYNPTTDQWTWLGGSTGVNQLANSGTIGVASASNWPGGRSGATAWIDNNGKVWIFGGDGFGNTTTHGRLGDMWKYDPVTGQWTWTKGLIDVNAGDASTPGPRKSGNTSWKDNNGNLWLFGGITGSQMYSPPCGGCPYYTLLGDLWRFNPNTNTWTGVNTPGEFPLLRTDAMTWVDNAGMLWLSGGWGRKQLCAGCPTNNEAYLNDVWKYNPSTNQWTKVRSQYGEYILGVYGVQGVTAATNNKGGRAGGVTWKDPSGKLCSFGGDLQEYWPVTYRNDTWTYDQVNDMYTWEKGDTVGTMRPFYTALGVADPANRPGERRGGAGWYDNNGNLWFMGGNVRKDGDIPVEFNLNDLWKYNITSAQWTCLRPWTGGNYSVQGVANASINPRGRESGVTWTDNANNLWVFGGYTGSTFINDLMKYDPSTGFWTWVHGSAAESTSGFSNGSYGTKGVANASNTPSTRQPGASWKDNAGNLWIFGGAGQSRWINDLWKYEIATNQWTWMSGDNVQNQVGVYGVKGVANSANKPGARHALASWTDKTGNLWLFGGYDNSGMFNDLWKYDIAANQWTWVGGDNTYNNAGVYGTVGMSGASNKPGARIRSATWIDANGNFWMMGGQGRDGAGNLGFLNDLWMYNPTSNEWTWAKGDMIVNKEGEYGIKNVGNLANKPGARFVATTWTDGVGDFWMYGGWGFAEFGEDRLSDLWKIAPALTAPLPVHFLEFKGRLVNDNGLLNWKTENEANASIYIVERSTDRKNYVAVGAINANNTTGMHQYNFTDPDIASLGAPVVYYRLKQKDFDGKATYSNIIALTIDRSFFVFFYPNPVVKMANVTITTDKSETIQVKVINSAGAVVKQSQWKLTSGSVSQTFDLGTLANGTYYLDLSGETISKRISFVKQ